jgi:hypothetical protein
MAAVPSYIVLARTTQKTPSSKAPFLLRDVTTFAKKCLLAHRLATAVFAEPLPRKGCFCWRPNSGFQQTCYNILMDKPLGKIEEKEENIKKYLKDIGFSVRSR